MKIINLFFVFKGPSIIYGLILFFLLLIFVFKTRYSLFAIRYSLISIPTLFFIYPIIQIFTQYSVWKSSPVMVYSFPPYQPAVKIFGIETGLSAYFFQYSYQHFIKEPLFTFSAALILSLIVFIFYKFNKFSKEDILFSAVGGLVSGWPGFVIYVFLVPILALKSAILQKYIQKAKKFSQSEPFTIFWLIAALLTLAFGDIIIKKTILLTLIV